MIKFFSFVFFLDLFVDDKIDDTITGDWVSFFFFFDQIPRTIQSLLHCCVVQIDVLINVIDCRTMPLSSQYFGSSSLSLFLSRTCMGPKKKFTLHSRARTNRQVFQRSIGNISRRQRAFYLSLGFFFGFSRILESPSISSIS